MGLVFWGTFRKSGRWNKDPWATFFANLLLQIPESGRWQRSSVHTVAAAQKQRPPARRLWLASAELRETRRRVGRVDLRGTCRKGHRQSQLKERRVGVGTKFTCKTVRCYREVFNNPFKKIKQQTNTVTVSRALFPNVWAKDSNMLSFP